MWSDDLLFLYCDRFFLDNVDYSIIGSLQIVKLSFGKYHFKRFGPVLMFSSASHESKKLYLKINWQKIKIKILIEYLILKLSKACY
jgi:hypothetical protein